MKIWLYFGTIVIFLQKLGLFGRFLISDQGPIPWDEPLDVLKWNFKCELVRLMTNGRIGKWKIKNTKNGDKIKRWMTSFGTFWSTKLGGNHPSLTASLGVSWQCIMTKYNTNFILKSHFVSANFACLLKLQINSLKPSHFLSWTSVSTQLQIPSLLQAFLHFLSQIRFLDPLVPYIWRLEPLKFSMVAMQGWFFKIWRRLEIEE